MEDETVWLTQEYFLYFCEINAMSMILEENNREIKKYGNKTFFK